MGQFYVPPVIYKPDGTVMSETPGIHAARWDSHVYYRWYASLNETVLCTTGDTRCPMRHMCHQWYASLNETIMCATSGTRHSMRRSCVLSVERAASPGFTHRPMGQSCATCATCRRWNSYVYHRRFARPDGTAMCEPPVIHAGVNVLIFIIILNNFFFEEQYCVMKMLYATLWVFNPFIHRFFYKLSSMFVPKIYFF